jgi:alpha-glutamyl/putrescinyl thymine pyrophosphorylase-like protein
VKYRRQLKLLGFGNHRKYESHQPSILYNVIFSFLTWVQENGGSPASAFGTNRLATPEANFEALYGSLKHIFRFGRTGAFDLLCLFGSIGILHVRPGSCYSRGSTGPLKGARKLWGKRPTAELGLLADATANALGIDFDVFEDALCAWQK